MSGVRELRDGLQARLATIANLTAYDTLPDIIMPPCAVVLPNQGLYEQTFGRGDMTQHQFELHLFVTLAGGIRNAEENLDVYMAASSTGGVYGAIHADRTLGGRAAYSSIRGYRDYGIKEIGTNMEFLGVTVDVEVWST